MWGGWDGAGRGSRTRCRLGPNEGAGGGDGRKGSPGGAGGPRPRAAWIDRLCVWSGAGLPAVPQGEEPGRGRRWPQGLGVGRGGGGTVPALLRLLSSPPWHKTSLGVFSLRVEIFGKFLANPRTCGVGGPGRWGSPAPPWRRRGEKKQSRLELEGRTQILAIALASSRYKLSASLES